MSAAATPVRALHELARHYGVQTSYIDLDKRRRAASQEALVAVLAALGAPLDRADQAQRALRDVERVAAEQMLPLVVVGRPDGVLTVPMCGRARGISRAIRFHVELESGISRAGNAASIAGRLHVPGPWPVGYHDLRIDLGRGTATVRVLIAPTRCHQDPHQRVTGRWGVFLPLYALRSKGDWGTGDFSGLGALLDWSADLGASVVGTLPLLAQFLDEPCDPSPYSPVSRMFWNEFFIDPRATAEWELSADAGRIGAHVRSRGLRDSSERLVNYRAIMRSKRAVLEVLAITASRTPARRRLLNSFVREHPEVAKYAAFRAACERHGVPWMNWTGRLRDGRLRKGDFDERAFRYHVYVQWVAEQQLSAASSDARGSGGGLYLDLPLGVNPAGYDTWRERDTFVSGLSAGAPPDPFFTKGQKWGLPPLNPHGLRRQGYRHLAACLRHHMRHAALLRIDHIMGFHRVFCVPQDADATDGVYVRYPAEEFYAVLKIESERARCAVAGEDLGTVSDRVRSSMRRHGTSRLYVMQFSFDGRRVATPPADSVASLNTHDMATFAGFYCGKDIDYRVDLGLMTRKESLAESRGRAGMRQALSRFLRREGLLREGLKPATPHAAMHALLRFLAKSPAAMVLINLEDLWGEVEQQNTPGTTSERVNWKRRAAKTFESFSRDAALLNLLREIDDMRRKRKVK